MHSTPGVSARPAWQAGRCTRTVAAFGLGLGLGFQVCAASPARGAELADLLAMDLTRLLDVEVSVASRREQNAFELPAALVVLSADDIRRSGHQHLADLLRDVAGFHVGRWDANKWAVSSRNGLDRFSSTLLVLVDGRPIYTPLFGGVRWEAQNLLLADVQRIEIIRGPGGPLWGANAVDGIVNVITRPAEATQGSLLQVGGGDGQWTEQLALRQGGTLGGSTYWRVSAQHLAQGPGRYLPADQSTHNGQRTPGLEANDAGWSRAISGRLDGRLNPEIEWSVQWQRSRSQYNEERALSGNRIQPNRMRYDGGFVSGELHKRTAALNWRVRLSLDQLDTRDDILRDRQRIADLDSQLAMPLGAHTLTVGAGWREYASHTTQPFRPPTSPPCVVCFGVSPASGGDRILSLFAQDQWALRPDVQLTAGAKVERYANGQRSWQPTLRTAWQATPDHTLWAAATQAVRSSTRLERDRAFFNVPASLAPQLGCRVFEAGTCLNGDPMLNPWVAKVWEAGWRARLAAGWDVDLAAFQSHYTGGTGNGQNQPLVQRKTRLHGGELQLRGQLTPSLLLKAHISRQQGAFSDNAAPSLPTPQLPTTSSMAQLSWNPHADWTVDGRLYNVGALRRNSPPTALAGYRRLDARVAWRAAPGWSWALSGSNLTDVRTAEYFEGLKVGTAQSRAWFLQLELRL